jgi:hypothetical protein
MSALLIASLILAGQLGQNDWCYVPPQSDTLFCDHVIVVPVSAPT